MFKVENVIAQCIAGLWLNKLGKMNGRKLKAQHINTLYPLIAVSRTVEPTQIAFSVLFFTINITGNTKLQLQVIFPGISLFIVIYHHAGIFNIPLGVTMVSFDAIIDRTWYLLL